MLGGKPADPSHWLGRAVALALRGLEWSCLWPADPSH
jgi:hypothetical protein